MTRIVKTTLDIALLNSQEILRTSVLDEFAALQQQIYARIDEKLIAVVQEMEHLEGENAGLQEQMTLCEGQDLFKTTFISATYAFQVKLPA